MTTLAPPSVPLTGALVGSRVEVEFLTLDEEHAGRLRDLGIREGARVRVIQSNGRLVVGLDEARIAIPGEVAAGIFVRDA